MLNNYFTSQLPIVLMTLLMISCASSPEKTVSENIIQPLSTQGIHTAHTSEEITHAKVFVYWPKRAAGDRASIYLNGQRVARIRNGQYVEIDTYPGTFAVELKWEDSHGAFEYIDGSYLIGHFKSRQQYFIEITRGVRTTTDILFQPIPTDVQRKVSNLLLYTSARIDFAIYDKATPDIFVVPVGDYPEKYSEKMVLIDKSINSIDASFSTEGTTKVYVYRPAGKYMKDRDVNIIVNGIKIATLKDGYHTVIPIEPGNIILEMDWAGISGIRTKVLKFTAEHGSTYYARISTSRSKPRSSSSIFTSINMMLHGGAIYTSSLYLEKEKSQTIRFESTFFSVPLGN